ncbi:MAG TPA: hypothetical protein VGI82_02350 [Chitinophagaceae bacterium]
MLITLFAWLYISFSCEIWGSLIIHLLNKIGDKQQVKSINFSLTCFLGLSAITVVASFLSLFMPLGGLSFQLILLLLTIAFLFFKPSRAFFARLKKPFGGLHFSLVFLFISYLIMLLIMSTWTINHPDTLSYHAQTIQWIEKYRAVPGLANLHMRYGLQNLWFVACAVFNFKFINLDGLTFINSTILVWYFIFILQKINENISSGNKRLNAFLWLALAAISISGYTQVRLTATSASSDFVATICVWTVFFLFLDRSEHGKRNIDWILITVLSFFAITLKLSVLPIILAALYATYKLFQKRQIRSLTISCLIAILIITPYFARNIISSGYVLFPSPHPNIANVDWKVDKEKTYVQRDYILAYARNPGELTRQEIKNEVAMKLSQWLPLWWKKQSLPDKISISLMVLAFIALLIKIKAVINSAEIGKTALIISIAGCIFWFAQAPDPRFGFGFIIGLPAVIAAILLLPAIKNNEFFTRRILIAFNLVFAVTLAVYDCYRLKNFFSPQQIVQPLGIEKIPFNTTQYNGIDIRVPEANEPCGDIQAPCTYDLKSFIPRGDKITDGFKEH